MLKKHSYELLSLLVIFIITLLLFKISFSYDFVVWDDRQYVKENPLLSTITWDNLRQNTVGNFHPLTNLIYSLIYQTYRIQVEPYHVTQYFIHFFNLILIFYIIQVIKKDKTVGEYLFTILIILIYAIHPFKMESVIWISELKDVLYSFFYLLGIYLYLKSNEKSNRDYTILLGIYILALSSKSMAITLPLVFILIDKYYFKKEFIWNNYKNWFWLALFIVVNIFVYLTFTTQGISTEFIKTSFYLKPIIVLYNLGYYALNTFIPIENSIIHPYPNSYITGKALIYETSGIVFLSVIYWLYKKKQHNVLVYFLMYLVIMLPVIQIFSVGRFIVSERYTYLSAIIPLIAIKNINWKYNNYVKCIMVLILVFLSIKSIEVINLWKDSKSIFKNAYYNYPNNYYGPLMYGTSVMSDSDNVAKKSWYLLSYVKYKNYIKQNKRIGQDEESICTVLGMLYSQEGKSKIGKKFFIEAYNSGIHNEVTTLNLCNVLSENNLKDSCSMFYERFKSEYKKGYTPIENYLKGYIAPQIPIQKIQMNTIK